LLEDHLFAHITAVLAVVDAIFCQDFRHILELEAGIFRNLGDGSIQHLVRDLDADTCGTLHLDLLDDQTLKHLFAQNMGRRQLHVLLGGPADDQVLLAVEFAFQDYTLVDDRGDAVDEPSGFRELRGEHRVEGLDGGQEYN